MIEEDKSGDDGKIEAGVQSSGDLPPKIEAVKELKISITKNLENGQLSIQGPGNGQMYDKWVCFGLFEDAKDFIKMHNARMAQSRIVKANPTMAQQIRGMFHKRR